MKVAIVQGTRPEIIKNYALVKALQDAALPYAVLHTNQHFEDSMRDSIYASMCYEPDKIMPGRYRLGSAIDWVQDQIQIEGIDTVIVNGDTAAALVGGLAAMYSDVALVHIEAGLRSQDVVMREERNRIMVDSIANYLFAYTEFERDELENSRNIRGKIFVEGNTTVDVLHDFADRICPPETLGNYVFATLHRKELTESYQRMLIAIMALNHIADNICPIVLPVHPRTRDALQQHNLASRLSPNVMQMEPMTPFESLSYQAGAQAVLTDSGCMQEEAYMFGVPCVTLRENTERHLTVQHLANQISGFALEQIIEMVRSAVDSKPPAWPEIYGRPGVGQRIIDRLQEHAAGSVRVRRSGLPKATRSTAKATDSGAGNANAIVS